MDYQLMKNDSASQSVSQCQIEVWLWIMNCKGRGRKRPYPILRCYHSIFRDRICSPTQILSKDSKLGPPKFEARELTTIPQCSVPYTGPAESSPQPAPCPLYDLF